MIGLLTSLLICCFYHEKYHVFCQLESYNQPDSGGECYVMKVLKVMGHDCSVPLKEMHCSQLQRQTL